MGFAGASALLVMALSAQLMILKAQKCRKECVFF
jgi:hypothetical protein